MSDDKDKKPTGGAGTAIVILGLMAFFAIPAVFPKFAVKAAVIIWPCIYVWLWYSAQHFSLLEHLPWTVESNTDPFSNWPFLAVLAGIAALFGIHRGIAVIIAWTPLMFLGSTLVALGLSVVHADGRYGYYRDNYTDNCGEMELRYRDIGDDGTATCLHEPAYGVALPSFTTKIYEDTPLEVIPYRGFATKATYRDLSNPTLSTDITKSVDESTTKTIKQCTIETITQADGSSITTNTCSE